MDKIQITSVDVLNDVVLNDVCTFLKDNYVSDGDLRFHYPVNYLRNVLTPPGYAPSLHLVMKNADNIILGCIFAVPLGTNTLKYVEINFLCVDSRLRECGIARRLINEISTRAKILGYTDAIYTRAVEKNNDDLTKNKNNHTCRFYHRPINVKKLISIRFMTKHPQISMTQTINNYQLDKKPTISICKMQSNHVNSTHQLLQQYLKQFSIHPEFTREEFTHRFYDGPVKCYVSNSFKKLDDLTPIHSITDMISFVIIPSYSAVHKQMLNVAYLYYYAQSKTSTTSLTELIENALILARDENADVVNCLDIYGRNWSDDKKLMTDLKFLPGTGKIEYHLPEIHTDINKTNIGVILL